MPFLEDDQAIDLSRRIDVPKGFTVTPGAADVEEGPAKPSWNYAAAFRRQNELAAFVSSESASTMNEPEPGFNPWDKVKGTADEASYERLSEARNERKFNALKADIARENEDRKLLDSQPWWMGLLTEGPASILSPTTLLPGGTFVKGAKGGVAIVRGAASVGASAAAGTAVQESMLQGIEQTRTAGESAVAIGASALIGSFLGGAGSAVLSRGEWSKGVAAVEADLAKPAMSDKAMDVLDAAANDNGGRLASVGAAANTATDIADNTIAGRAASATAAATARMNPLLRALHSPSAVYRDVMLNTVENPLYLTKNMDGVASLPAAETLMKEYNGKLAQALDATKTSYDDYRKTGGQLDRQEYREAVGRAMRRDDADADPFIAKTAQEWRAKVFDPLKDRAIEMGLLPKDVAPSTASSYFTRMWNGRAISADEQGFKGMVVDWAEKQLPDWTAQYDRQVESRLNPLRREIDELEMAKLRRGEELNRRRFDVSSGKTHDVFHGTDTAFEQFDPSKLGSFTGAPSAKEGFFFSKSAQTADTYTNRQYATRSELSSDDLAQLEGLEARLAKEKEGVSTRSKLQAIEDEIAAFRQSRIVYAEGSNVRPARLRIDNPFIHDFKGAKFRDNSYSKLIAEAKAGGHDGVIFKNTYDGGPLDDIYVVFDPKQIGSKFDSGSREVAAGGVGEMTEADIRNALQVVQGKAPKPKGVKTLSQFVVEAGGLVDYAEELATRGITNRVRPGMIRSSKRTMQGGTGGWELDDMARHAWESGYFPNSGGRPSIDEFIEALNDDFHKIRRVVKDEDRDAFRLQEYVDQLEADLARAGVDTGSGKAPRFATSDEMKGAVQRVYQAMDAEADRKIAALKDRLTERDVDARVEREARYVGDPKQLANDIANEVFDTLTGRTASGPRPEFLTIKARGPLKERTFSIPDLFRGANGRGVEDYLEHDVEKVARRYTRVMGADIELTRKFGSVDMAEQIAKIREDYANLRSGVTDEKQLLKLQDREKADIRDLEAMRDMLRGTDPGAAADTNYSRVVRNVNHFNYLRSMGEVAIASLTETVRPAMVHGLMPYMETLGQTLGNMKGIRASVSEAQLAGNVVERVLGSRLATLSEITDPYTTRGPIESFMENMTNIASKWNGIRLLTDMQKSIASVMTQNRLLRGSELYGQVAEKERAYLAYLGIDESMAGRIAEQFKAHGEILDKVRVANTEAWTDDVARRTYRAAMNKDVDSIITTKGVADTPLFANTPTGKAMLQFKSFALASHQRVLLRGLQEDQSRFVGGLIAMTTIGMMATWFKAQSGNRDEKLANAGEQPGWWIAEGLDKSGILAIPMELANAAEKATGFNPIKTPIKAFDEKGSISQKNQNKSLVGTIAGPTAGLVDDASNVAGIPKKLIDGEEVPQSQKNAAERLLPFNSYIGIRQMLRYVVNPPAN